MNLDDHLIFEAFAQHRIMTDEQAAKLIVDKIKGTPGLNMQNIKMYVSKYLGMVGKAPTDVDHIAAYVLDILNSQGMAENAEEINVQKADLNKDKKLSDYELARAKAIVKAQGENGEVPSEDAEGKSSKLHPNTIKAQQLLDQAVQLIIKATNMPNVQWRYYDENNPDVDLQNALENIKDYVKQYIGF